MYNIFHISPLRKITHIYIYIYSNIHAIFSKCSICMPSPSKKVSSVNYQLWYKMAAVWWISNGWKSALLKMPDYLIVTERCHIASWTLGDIGLGNDLCPTAPNHYLNQCWLVMSRVLPHSPKGNSNGNMQEVITATHLKIILLRSKPAAPGDNVLSIFISNCEIWHPLV